MNHPLSFGATLLLAALVGAAWRSASMPAAAQSGAQAGWPQRRRVAV